MNNAEDKTICTLCANHYLMLDEHGYPYILCYPFGHEKPKMECDDFVDEK